MKNRNLGDYCKNAVGTVFLLAGAFFVCSTLVSMRAVFADPIAPSGVTPAAAQSARATGTTARSGRASPRTTATNTAATTARTVATPSRSVAARRTTSRATASNTSSRATSVNTASRANTVATPSRNVVARSANTASSRATTANRAVRARTATTSAANNARVSLSGSAIRGSSSTTTNNYTYLSNKLYTGNYANIIDSSTGLISSEAYSNCMESYYACMDEICTARNAAQRRCACAGRVKAFAEAESALETANEELIKVSGELALLIATKGKDVSVAFQLTDAEKIMNCAAYVELINSNPTNDAVKEWCSAHPEYSGNTVSTCNNTTPPTYCSDMGTTYGFSLNDLSGSSSDILASLKSWADAKDNTMTILSEDTDNLLGAYNIVSNAVNATMGFDGAFADSANLTDSLAETWGYELFEYAHNNVCARVLDSCFNGIYEACGTPPSGGRKCGNGASQCPYNYNSVISVNNTGSYELNFVSSNSGYTTSNSATCFGYTSASGDPYSNLRGPVADARRSIMQKYALDANADCDAYGEQLSTQAQNIAYQKVAAQQALQQKRLEFYQEEQETVLSEAKAAGTNFNECISEIYDCYETQYSANKNWTEARIRTYCAQISNVPHCYETMICNPSTAQFMAVIDEADSEKCNNDQDYTKNTCRNIVTLNEILNGVSGADSTAKNYSCSGTTCDSAKMREACLLGAGASEVRDWYKSVKASNQGTTGSDD